MLGPKDHALALGTRGSALALEGEAVARGIAHHSIIPLFHAQRCAETYCPLFQHSIIPIFPDGAWGVLSIRRSFSFNFTLFLETFVLETFCPEGATKRLIIEATKTRLFFRENKVFSLKTIMRRLVNAI